VSLPKFFECYGAEEQWQAVLIALHCPRVFVACTVRRQRAMWSVTALVGCFSAVLNPLLGRAVPIRKRQIRGVAEVHDKQSGRALGPKTEVKHRV